MNLLHARIPTAVCLAVLALPPVRAQQTPLPNINSASEPAEPGATLPKYDVVSIRKNRSLISGMIGIQDMPDGILSTNISLKFLLVNAYHIRPDLISGGPAWVQFTSFYIQAKVAPQDVAAYKKMTRQQKDVLLQDLLADRFKLIVQKKTKVLPMYALVVGKDGSKLKALPPDATASTDGTEEANSGPSRRVEALPGNFNDQDVSIQELAANLSTVLQHTVVDRTGLTGKYDVRLKWAFKWPAPLNAVYGTDSHVSIFTAVQEQLGLKLQPTKGPTETLVIKHADMPSQN